MLWTDIYQENMTEIKSITLACGMYGRIFLMKTYGEGLTIGCAEMIMMILE